jgi:leucyl aminopeptidase (aminopeptidase T)
MSLDKAARIILSKCLGVTQNETLFIMADADHLEFGKILQIESQKLKVQSAFLDISLNGFHNAEFSPFLVNLASQANGVLLLTGEPVLNSLASLNLAAIKTRFISLVDVKEQTLRCIIKTRYRKVKSLSQKIADILTIGKKLTLTSETGSNMQLCLTNVKGYSNTGMAVYPGQITTLPAGEAYCTPIAEKCEGTLIVDGAIDCIEKLSKPIELKISKGLIKRILGNGEVEILRKRFKAKGTKTRQIVGFGIGTNEVARFGISMDESKKVLGTAHFSFGKVEACNHAGNGNTRIDMVITKPTVVIDGKEIIHDGVIMIDTPSN